MIMDNSMTHPHFFFVSNVSHGNVGPAEPSLVLLVLNALTPFWLVEDSICYSALGL